MAENRFDFEFQPQYRALVTVFGAGPGSAYALVDNDAIKVRFGFVSLTTPLANVEGVERSGNYRWWKAIGIRMSLTDRGLTFGSSTRNGVCLKFKEPVRPKPSAFGMSHPGLTLTLADPDGFVEALHTAGGPSPA